MMPKNRLGDTGNTVAIATVRSGGELQEMWGRGGGALWLKWEMIVEWKEQVTVTYT
jgi:hypothetical protein